MQSLRRPASLPLTSSLPWPARARLERVSRVVRADEQEVLAREGEAPPCWHFLDSGAVALASTSRAGRRCVLSILGPGGVFGPPSEHADPGPPASPEARALVASTVLLVPSIALDYLVHQDGDFAAWMSSSLHRQSERFQQTLTLTLGLRVPERVMQTFISLARTHGRPTPGGTVISFPLCQETVACMVGASRESVNRAIRRLEAVGAVRRAGRSYVVSDRATSRRARGQASEKGSP